MRRIVDFNVPIKTKESKKLDKYVDNISFKRVIQKRLGVQGP